jgi:PleD family two-component response regulator
MKILIAAADALSRPLLEKTLLRDGYAVVSVADGRQAVDCLGDTDGPRLALLDWMLPELDGPSVCRKIRQRHDQRVKITMSFGSEWSHCAADELLREVDVALYSAKAASRNCTQLARPADDTPDLAPAERFRR